MASIKGVVTQSYYTDWGLTNIETQTPPIKNKVETFGVFVSVFPAPSSFLWF